MVTPSGFCFHLYQCDVDFLSEGSMECCADPHGRYNGDKLTDIKISCVRKLFEKVPSAKFIKSGTDEEDGKATYELKIPGLPPLARSAKNYKVAKIAVAKAALRMLKEKENNVDRLNRWK
ncbi:hypothetical protein GWK47_036042 [Chionoecetes opilio]|uniref:Dicer double-stranded RNA-binding domain-containing protein n=1 Tax=Chionoecetes opilio TaxID=41210 RepID=A0A8J5D2V8_CHIOP|nr:hypothetical protein GWK47_036042 [Chionoecetes opilio]